MRLCLQTCPLKTLAWLGNAGIVLSLHKCLRIAEESTGTKHPQDTYKAPTSRPQEVCHISMQSYREHRVLKVWILWHEEVCTTHDHSRLDDKDRSEA